MIEGGTLEAILLVGGQGTRLRPLTISRPKPLLPTAGVPFLAHQLARAGAFGVRHVVLATSYRTEMFTACFGDGSDFGLELDYVTEATPLGTGGGIRNAATRLRAGPDDPILVLNGDVLSGHDVAAQLALHQRTGAAATLHLVGVTDPSRFGCVPIDASGRVTAFLEKAAEPVTNLINAGCYVFRRATIDQIPADKVVSVERETFPGLIAAGAPVMGYVDEAYWLDVGTPETFIRGCCDLVLGRLHSPAVPEHSGETLIAESAQVSQDAQLSAGTVVGEGCVIGNGANVAGSVLFPDVVVADGARIRASVVGAGASIGTDTVLDGAVVGDSAVISPGNELRNGVRIWPGVQLAPCSLRFSSDV